MTQTPAQPSIANLATEEEAGPHCVMCFNVTEPTGGGGIGGDVATVSAMGGHSLPVVTGVLIRDSAQVYEHHALDDDLIVEQARTVLEDMSISAWKVGFLGNPENVSAVAEILSDYADLPLVVYLPSMGWQDEAQQFAYHEALRELVLPQAHILVGHYQTLIEFLLPEWDQSRPPTPRELAVEAAQSGVAHILVTGIRHMEQWIENVLANPQGPILTERFERIDAAYIGAGDTLSAAITTMLANGADIPTATLESLSFLDQSLDAGFRPGMGNALPDRFFWAQAPEEEGAEEEEEEAGGTPPPQMH
jgi:hydroxymethylpyrimidine/phosphomethylpyrimidine kinase